MIDPKCTRAREGGWGRGGGGISDTAAIAIATIWSKVSNSRAGKHAGSGKRASSSAKVPTLLLKKPEKPFHCSWGVVSDETTADT